MVEAQPIVPGDLRKSGRSCQFCLWRETAPIELGWERLWDEQGNDLLSTQDALDPGFLSTQQTIGILDKLDCAKFDFPEIDESVKRLLAEAEKREPDSHGALVFEPCRDRQQLRCVVG